MTRRNAIAPFVILVTHYSLPGKQIWPGTPNSGWFVRTMKINGQMMFGSQTGQTVIKIDDLLIITRHEIDLDTGNSPFFIKRKCLFHLLIGIKPIQPYKNFDTLFLSILHQFGNINISCWF